MSSAGVTDRTLSPTNEAFSCAPIWLIVGRLAVLQLGSDGPADVGRSGDAARSGTSSFRSASLDVGSSTDSTDMLSAGRITADMADMVGYWREYDFVQL